LGVLVDVKGLAIEGYYSPLQPVVAHHSRTNNATTQKHFHRYCIVVADLIKWFDRKKTFI
jgi:hypothetical protein